MYFSVKKENDDDYSLMDAEKELFSLKRKVGSFFSKGNYQEALNSAEILQEKVQSSLGTDNSIYASTINDVALMHKMLGNHEKSMELYTEALHKYHSTVGKDHASYAHTLQNLGVLYKTQAEASKGMDKDQLLTRAEEALKDAVSIFSRLSSHGPTSKETLVCSNNLNLVYSAQGRHAMAIENARYLVSLCKEELGLVVVTANALNNLALILKRGIYATTLHAAMHNEQDKDQDKVGGEMKSSNDISEAIVCYREALSIKRDKLGEDNPDTIITMHNLSTLLLEQEDDEDARREAVSISDRVLEILGETPTSSDRASTSNNNARNRSLRDLISSGDKTWN